MSDPAGVIDVARTRLRPSPRRGRNDCCVIPRQCPKEASGNHHCEVVRGGLEPPTHGFSVPCNSPIRVEKHRVSENGTADRGHNRGHFSELDELVALYQGASQTQRATILMVVRTLANS